MTTRKEVEILFAKIPSSVQSSDLEFLLGGLAEGVKYHTPAKEYGERAYRIKGKFGTLVYFDEGNGWRHIMRTEKLRPDSYGKIKARFKRIEEEGWEE